MLLNTANNNAFAQVGTLQENPFSKENYTEAKKLERLVYNTILPYLKGTNFLVDVKILSDLQLSEYVHNHIHSHDSPWQRVWWICLIQ